MKTTTHTPEAKKKKIIISGGGTGGHVFPAIAIANALKKANKEIEILFVGAKGKLEMEKVPQAGYPIIGLWISGFQRRFTLKNFLFPFKLLNSIFKARRIIHQFKPDVVVGVGGYASGPLVASAARKGVPVVLQEQNSFPGITNRLLAKKAAKICVAYEKMEHYFPPNKIVCTGNPVRQDIWNKEIARSEAIKYFNLDNSKKTIVLLGGSLGAKTLNEAMGHSTQLLRKKQNVQVLWQAGKLYLDSYKNSPTAKLPNVEIRAFVDRMDLAYAAADLLVCRAGALTISELCLVGKPAILVPSPNVAEDHQTKNAMALVEKNAAIMVKDQEAPEKMLSMAMELLEDENRMKNLGNNIKSLAKPNANRDIANEILNLL